MYHGAAPNVSNFRANDPTQGVYDVYVARIDHVFGEKDRIFGRFLAQTDHEPTASIYPTPGTDNFGVLAHNYYYNPSGYLVPQLHAHDRSMNFASPIRAGKL